jgi:ABC-type transport system involved in multi-copper enzyme maturation permease subunit
VNNIIAISLISFKEGLRHRVLYGIVIFALLLMAFSVLFSGLFMRDISKIILDLCLSAVNAGGLLIPFFLAVNLLAKDIERRTIVTILSRPISRNQYIVGKYFGIVLLTGLVMLVLSGATFVSVWIGKLMYGEIFFSDFSIGAVIAGILLSFLGMMVLNALVVLWCSVTTSAFIATLLTLFTYLIGQTIDDVVRFLSVELSRTGAEISNSVRYAINIAQYLFPNLSSFDIKLQAAHGILIPFGDIAFLAFYGAAYIISVLSISLLIFNRRDFA